VGGVWQKREPEWLPDLAELSPQVFVRSHIAQELGLRSAFAVPILATCNCDESVLAILVFFMRSTRPEDTRLIKLVSTISAQLCALMQRKQMEAALRESEESFRLTFENAPIGIAMTNLQGGFLQVNQIFCDITAYSRSELLKLSFHQVTHPSDLAKDIELVDKLLAGAVARFELEKRLLCKDGRVVDVMAYASVIRDQQGQPLYIIGQVEDITARKQAKAQIEHMAFHDPLTDLPNRILFIDRLHLALQQAREVKNSLAVLFLDLDRFKLVNDTLGHDMGDRLLQAVVKRLSSNIRRNDTLARMGGDEFMLLMPSLTSRSTAQQLAARLIKSFEVPFRLDDHEVHIGVSIGISVFPEDGMDGETLMKNADTAMFRAKEQGRNHYQVYTPSLGAQTRERASLENGIRRALQHGEFVLYYQPQYELRSQEIIGVEALVRWQNPELGLTYPAQFIGYAEECGLIAPLGEWILHSACTQNRLWQDLGIKPIRVSVNCSVRQFHNRDMASRVEQILLETGLLPQHLELEITESAMMMNEVHTLASLQRLQEIGVPISIDDFGTGYSSLSNLKQFPVQKIKIDSSFIEGIPHDRGDMAITRAIVAMAHSMQLEVIAEGVETPEQLAFLQELQCDAVQGFLLSQPLPSDAMTQCLLNQPTRV
jgi:diguanylate cyclase (GGDEF)-like protein/PAS domain S-box-containing protein